MSRDDDESLASYTVVVNDEEQTQSGQPTGRFRVAGPLSAGSVPERSAWSDVKELWTDMRPLSLRRHMDEARRGTRTGDFETGKATVSLGTAIRWLGAKEARMTNPDRGKLQETLGLAFRPVALAFRPSPPAGVPRVSAPMPAGCAYWKAASEGHTFYTDAADHFGCPVGAHTHGVPLTPEKSQELGSLIETMLGLDDVQAEELPELPHRSEPFGVLVYGPLDEAEFDPDVVIVRGSVTQIMMVSEAARAAGVFVGQALGRPACAIVPSAINSGQAVASVGCIGNRVYTGLGDGEMYFAIPGARLAAVIEKVPTIVAANRALGEFHQGRSVQAV